MKVSLNTVKQFTTIDMSHDELREKINTQLGAIEEIIDLATKYKDAVIVRVASAKQHPSANRLKVTKIDDGGKTKDVPRDEDGYVQVVCGAPNAREGIFAVWLPPKSTVPATYDDNEPFVLDARELRGVLSQGMLAAPDELAIGNEHAGILEIDPDEWKPSDEAIKPGASFAKVYGLDDTIIDIENKMFTHRPDLFGQLGVARELAGIQGKQFTSPKWYLDTPKFDTVSSLPLEVFNDAPKKSPRFMAVAIENIQIKPSPLWLQCALVAMGSKPINNIVDVTNYVMLLTAQPTHAYDYDKIRGSSIGVRMAKKGESVTLLNDKTYELDEEDIIIVDKEGPIGLAGIMGGGESEVDENTKNIVLEVANFDMYTVRKSSMRHGVFTDALTRFNKGQSALQNDHILSLLMQSVFDVSSGKQASTVFDERTKPQPTAVVSVTAKFINERLGSSLSAGEITQLLQNVECSVSGDKTLLVEPPFWRTDIELPEDVVEEVGRLYGYDKLTRELPRRTTKPTPKNTFRDRSQYAREQLSKAGANEVLTYSFVHKKIITNAGQDTKNAYKLSNALSPDLQYYRLSLTPSLLDKVHMNHKAGFDKFALYELNKVHYKGEMDETEPTVPNEDNHVALVLAYGDKQKPAGSPYYHARKYLEQIVDLESNTLLPLAKFDLSTDNWGAQLTAPYVPERSAVVVKDGQVWGVVGEFTQSVRSAFKLPAFAAGFEMHSDLISASQATYTPLSRFPSVTQDLSLKVVTNVTYQSVIDTVKIALAKQSEVTIKISPVSIYQAQEADKAKTITLRFKVTSYNKTLSDSEVRPIIELAIKAAESKLDAAVV